MPESLSSRLEAAPGFDAIAAVGDPAAQRHTKPSLSIFEGAFSPVQSERPVFGYEAALYKSRAVPEKPPSGTPDREEPGPSQTLEEAQAAFPYSLRLGAFRTLDRAKKAVGAYNQNGSSPYWTKVDLGDKGVWFRVYLGHFEDREKALRFREERGLKESLVKATRYTTLVGVYENEDELESQTLSLQDLNYAPYALKDQKGRYRLLVGAFMTEEGAQAQQRDLEIKGIQSKVIRR
jgi:cell division septation protein DedD